MQVEKDHITDNGVKAKEKGKGEATFVVRATTNTTVQLQWEAKTSIRKGSLISFFIWFDKKTNKKEVKIRRKKSNKLSRFRWYTAGKPFSLSAGTHLLHLGDFGKGSALRTLNISSGNAFFLSVTNSVNKSACEEASDTEIFLSSRGLLATCGAAGNSGLCTREQIARACPVQCGRCGKKPPAWGMPRSDFWVQK